MVFMGILYGLYGNDVLPERIEIGMAKGQRAITSDVGLAFGQALREARKAAKVSQNKLGFESGYHPAYISMLERGLQNPSLRTILAISKVLKTSPGCR
jgi:DNA-binding XRE family transcriptional regulator